MDTPRHLRLLASGDIAAWPDLSRDLERRCDADGAAEALRLLHAQGNVVEAAQWLARVANTDTLQTLRASLRAQAEAWPIGPLRALARDLLSGTFRLIPAGSFLMGSPEDEEGRFNHEPQHEAEVTTPFLLKTTPVTQAEWQAVMGNDPSYFQGDARRPAERVSWEDAVRFCETLSAHAGGTYRLPTEVEWERACRAGTTSARYGHVYAVAWCEDNAQRAPHPVAQKQPNAWGLYDMLGNIWEWCQDGYVEDPRALQPDLRNLASNNTRVVRGGAWNGFARNCRAARRYYALTGRRYNNIGLRPARSLR